jgi:hypothetical protein
MRVTPRVPRVSAWLRVLAGSIVVLGVAVAVALPNGYTCGEGDSLEVHRQWSFFQERWSYGCHPDPETIEQGFGLRMGAATDWRIPLRVGVGIAGFAVARAVVVLVSRPGLLGAASNSQGQPASTVDRRQWIFVAVYALFGAAIAVLVTLRQDEYWVRGTGGPPFSTRSFLGLDMTPVLAEALVAIVGAVGGTALGLLVFRLHRRFEASRAMTAVRERT